MNNQSSYPTVIIGSDPEKSGEENYFYYEPRTDASIIIQAAIDYLDAIQSSFNKGETQ